MSNAKPYQDTRKYFGSTYLFSFGGFCPEKELDPSNATAFAPDAPSYFGILARWLSQPLKIH